MIISPVSNQPQHGHPLEHNSPAALITALHPECKQQYFDEPLNEFDKQYAAGMNRQTAFFLPDYFSRKANVAAEMQKIYSPCINLRKIDPQEAHTTETSWSTVLSGIRPMGQFSVNTLLSPELHAMLALPEIGSVIFPRRGNAFMHVVCIYRKDAPEGEVYARRFVELFAQKGNYMEGIPGDHMTKVLESEKIVGREFGQLFFYREDAINNYIEKLDTQLAAHNNSATGGVNKPEAGKMSGG